MTNVTQAVVMDRNGANYCGRLWWKLDRARQRLFSTAAGCRPGLHRAAGGARRKAHRCRCL
jgi:hypothetical protein